LEGRRLLRPLGGGTPRRLIDATDVILLAAPAPAGAANCFEHHEHRLMDAPAPERPQTELPHAIILIVAVTCGVMGAIAVQVLLAQCGVELTAAWRDFGSAAAQLRSASAWWAIAAAAFTAGAVAAGTAGRMAAPWKRFRLLLWIGGAAIVFALAHVGHSAALETGSGVAVLTTANLAAFAAAALMALAGARFAAVR